MMNVVIQKFITGSSAVEVAASIERAIREGRLAPGERLPPVRELARARELSPTTVAAAYRTLRTRGLLLAEGRRGTRVRGRPALTSRSPAPVPSHARDLAVGDPDPRLLPPLAGAVARIDLSPHLYADGHQLPALERQARRQLERDGIPADQTAVTSGALDAIERVLEAQLRPGDRVAVEDPAFSAVLDLCGALGLVPVPVALDDAGPLPDALEAALASGADAFVLTPRAQNPTGAALDPRRARELRRVLRAHPDPLLIEDDHAGSVAGVPALMLCERRRRRWAVVRSVSKTLGPDLRLAYLTGDRETLARVEGRQRIGFRWVSHLLQRLVVELWSDPATRARVRQAERSYTRRRRALLDALAARGVEAHGRSGLNVWIPVPEEGAAVQALLESGWAVAAGERFRLESAPAIRVTIATLTPDEARALADDIADLLTPGSGASPA
jgi:DNA-binding transcriptional MocR family regulator